ncbi:MAG: hypothetical protein ACLFTY_01605 [Candidatus Aenigmatarchaeota archaeon]
MPEEFECSDCGKTFDTKKGLHVHQSQVHSQGESDEGSETEENGKAESENFSRDSLPFLSPWKWGVVLLAVLLLINIYFSGLFGSCITGEFTRSESLDANEVGEKAVSFLNSEMIQQGEAELVNVSREDELYKVTTGYQNQEIPVYATLNGEKLIMSDGIIDMDQTTEENTGENTDSQGEEIPTEEKPTVELFVQSFCPYGNQAENTMEPVHELLGDKVNWEPHFIVRGNSEDGFQSLHGQAEVEQDERELCVLEDNGVGKWFEFATYVNDNCGSEGQCWQEAAQEAGLSVEEIESCVENRGDELLEEEAKITQERGVSASPTLFINGVESEAVYEYGNPDAYKKTICSGFEAEPDACSETLGSSSENTAPAGSC